MVIANLQLHGSAAPGSQEFYTADLMEGENSISVRFVQNAGANNWTVYNQNTGAGYPVVSVGDSNKDDISTWRGGDTIQLGPYNERQTE